MGEIWEDIEEYEGYYQISNLGRVKSLSRIVDVKKDGKIFTRNIEGKSIKTSINSHGYKNVQLCKNGKIITTTVHRLVAITFVKNELNKSQINHIDGNKLNNHMNNLEWCTPSENVIHAFKNGLRQNAGNKKETIPKHLFKKVQCIETGLIFESIKEASIFYKCNKNKIGMVCKGRRKSCGKIDNIKLTWRYVNE